MNAAKSKNSDTGTRTLVSCVKGKYADHLHHIGMETFEMFASDKRRICKYSKYEKFSKDNETIRQ